MKTAKRIITRGLLVMVLTWMVMTAIGMVGTGAGSKTAQAETVRSEIKIPKNANKKDAKAAKKLNQLAPFKPSHPYRSHNMFSYQWKKGRLVKLVIYLEVAKPKLMKMVITELKSLTDLKELRLYVPRLKRKYKLDLSKNKKLESLLISVDEGREAIKYDGSTFSRVDISKNKKLKKLDILNIGKINVNVSKNTKLEYLRLENLTLTKLALSQNRRLKEIYLSGTKLEELDVSKNVKLKYLSINLPLKGLDISNLRNLRVIDIDHVLNVNSSDIDDIPVSFHDLPLLTLLRINEPICACLNVTNCSRLKELVMDYDAVKKITIKKCPKLLPSNGFGISNWIQRMNMNIEVYKKNGTPFPKTPPVIYEDQQYKWDWEQDKWMLSTETAS